MSTDPSLLDEHVLRRALRLEAEEVPPRLDPALIASVARASRRSFTAAVAAAATVAFISGWIWSGIVSALAGAALVSAGIDPLGLVIDAADSALVRLAPIAQVASTPVVPIAILVAAAMAAFFEHMKGKTDATPS